MSRIIIGPLLCCCAAQLHAESVPDPVALTNKSSADDVLVALQTSGKDLHTFTADVTMSEGDPDLGSFPARLGKVWIDVKPDGDTRFHALFTEKKTEKKTIQEKIEYLFAGGKLIDRNYDSSPRTQVTRQVLKPGEKLNLLKLGEGPFPLPIGQDPAEVKRQFEVTSVEPSKDDPAATVHLQLKPNPDTSMSTKFKLMDIYVDTQTGLPKRIELLDLNGSSIRQTDLANVKINSGVADADFEVEKVDPKDWQMRDESMER